MPDGGLELLIYQLTHLPIPNQKAAFAASKLPNYRIEKLPNVSIDPLEIHISQSPPQCPRDPATAALPAQPFRCNEREYFR